MAGVEDGGQTDARDEGLDHDTVHLVVYDVAGRSKVYGIDDFIVAVFFIPIKIRSLTTVAYVVSNKFDNIRLCG